MTMLDRMRRHKGWLKWSLALVALTMVLFLSPDFLTGTQGVVSRTDAVADVDGAPITVGEYQRVLNNRLQQFRASGGNLSEEMLKQLGIDRQVLQSLIDERAIEAEAKRRGIRVSDAEVRAYILRMPAFQDNGQFAGYDRYRAVLRAQRPPLSEEEFEETMRRALLAEKLQEAVTGWLQVSDAEADEEYRRRNEKVKLEAVAFQADQFREGLTATDAEITAHFEKNKDKYRIGERRKVRYLLVDTQSLRNQITPTPLELERFYNANTEQFSNPEQVHASHILLKTAGKDEAAVRKQAESVLAEVKAGGDFAALATKYSEDEVSKARGGDLDFFGRGSMVKPFEDAAFALEPGQISDLVKTNYGFHIIKAVEKRPAGQRPFADVRDQIAEQLKWQQAQERATTLSTELDTKIDESVRSRSRGQSAGADRQGIELLPAHRPGRRARALDADRDRGVLDEGRRCEPGGARAARLRDLCRLCPRGGARPEGGRGQGARARRRHHGEGEGGRARQGGAARRRRERRDRLCGGCESRRARGPDERAHRARRRRA